MRVWDLDRQDNLAVLDGHGGEEVYCLCLNHTIVASGAADSRVCLWSRHTYTLLHVLEGHVGVVRSMRVRTNAHGFVLVHTLSRLQCHSCPREPRATARGSR